VSLSKRDLQKSIYELLCVRVRVEERATPGTMAKGKRENEKNIKKW